MRSVLLSRASVLALSAAVAALAVGAGAASAHPAPGRHVDLIVHAGVLHVGDGRVLRDVAVAVDGGRIVEIAPEGKIQSVSDEERRAATLLPGLIASVMPESASDAPSVDADRRAAAGFDASLARGWTERGVTALAVTPGAGRLVAGRAGLVRLSGATPEISVDRGAICASLSDDALAPPLVFEPPLRTNADNPLPPARPQRPSTTMAAVGELRRLVASDAAFEDVRARRVPLRVHADREEDIRRVIALGGELGIDVVLEGGTEAWKLADDLAAARVLVVLSLPDPSSTVMMGRDIDPSPDAAGILERAGVALALESTRQPRVPDPLLLAASAMRQGLSEPAAIAGLTGRMARAAGAPGFGLVEEGRRADLVGFDVSPLALRATPAFVLVDGRLASEAPESEAGEDEDEQDAPAPLAMRAGRVLTGKGILRDGIVLMAGGKIVSVGTSPALPENARFIDHGADAVLAPGFVDAFGMAGLEPGPPPGGSPRLRAADAIEARHPSLRRALRAGVTSALVVPGSRGLVLGMACSAATAPKPDGSADILASDPAFVFWLDEGPGDMAARAPRLKALKDLLQKAKGHHEERAKAEKPEKSDKDEKAAKTAKTAPEKRGSKKRDAKKDEPDPSLEALRALFTNKAKPIVRSGRADMMLEALDAFKGAGLSPVLAGAEEADAVAAEIAQRGVSVILSPRTSRRVDGELVSVAARLRAAGVSVAMGSFGFGGSDQLPLAACAAVRDGLSPEDALAALTTSAAAIVGPADVGRLEAGARADVVAWSGDPLEPASRVLAVVSGGRLIEDDDEDAEGKP